jgi:hypothetical protein
MDLVGPRRLMASYDRCHWCGLGMCDMGWDMGGWECICRWRSSVWRYIFGITILTHAPCRLFSLSISLAQSVSQSVSLPLPLPLFSSPPLSMRKCMNGFAFPPWIGLQNGLGTEGEEWELGNGLMHDIATGYATAGEEEKYIPSFLKVVLCVFLHSKGGLESLYGQAVFCTYLIHRHIHIHVRI